ncbi:MAG: cation transporter [Butyrivibrio sp.]|uniref:cation diffusion facilitator family transporter n=1 Tax=Butyrivibrio sp. TaxID=28121 RepID=UPI001B4C8215|nr:cation diffusion facilitator family transporter [Butyrivibrio sp.]MBP3782934.1 cation transporter [Butyrivibrio sp.]
MISFLARFFIKDHKQVDSPIVRQSYGMLSGAFGIAFNIILVIFKMIAGVLSGSIAVFSDALNNLSDVTSSVVTLIFFKLSGRDADEEHPFGHGRLEYVAGLIVSLLIIIMAVELLNGSIMKIIHPEDVELSFVIVLILVVSIFIKFIMFASYLQTAKLIDSATIRSAAMDSLSDVLSTSIVLVSLIVFEVTKINVDGYAGIVVALFIFKTGIDAAKDTINPLLGEPPSREFLREIEKTVLAHECVLGVHDIVVHNYGPSRVMMSLHVEVPSDENLITIHDIIDEIEKELRQKYHCTAVIHMDPVDSSDSEAMAIKNWLTLNIEEIDPSIKFHDLRLVRKEGEKPIVEFDLEVPYRYKMADDELVKLLENRLKEIGDGYSYDITVDKKEK